MKLKTLAGNKCLTKDVIADEATNFLPEIHVRSHYFFMRTTIIRFLPLQDRDCANCLPTVSKRNGRTKLLKLNTEI